MHTEASTGDRNTVYVGENRLTTMSQGRKPHSEIKLHSPAACTAAGTAD